MDPSRGDSRYNLNYSMSSIGLTLADQNDMYGNPAAVAALGGRPPSAGLLQSISGGGGPSGSLASRSSGNLMSNSPQCQSLSNSSGQQRGIKRAGSDCYEESHHRGVGNVGSGGISLQGLDNCSTSNIQHSGQQQQQQQQQPQSNAGGSDAVDDNYNSQQSKKSPPANGKKTKGRVKIKMEYIDNKLRRYTTFSKRKIGIMKKAYELSTLTGTQVMLLVASETGHVYTFATRKLQPMITSEAGKQLIQTCLNSPDPPSAGGGDQRMSATGFEETELSYNIADEDSKEIRSPFPSINDSDDSSDLEGIGVNNYDGNNVDTPLIDIKIESETKFNKRNLKNEKHKQEHHKPSITNAESKRDESHSQNNTTAKKELSSLENLVHQPSDLSSVPQGVLLQLIEAGHLQVHTEEDGSGLQYVVIPLHPSTVDLLHSNKSITNVTLTKSEETADNLTNLISIHKEIPSGVIIKQEISE